MASRRGFAKERRADIELVVERITTLVDQVTKDHQATVADIVDRFGQQLNDVREWLAQTRWACKLDVDLEKLQNVIDTLEEVGVIDEPVRPARFGIVAPNSKLSWEVDLSVVNYDLEPKIRSDLL